MTNRNDEPNEIVSVGGNAPPDWLTAYNEKDESLTDMAEYKVLSRLKVVQGLSKQELKETFGEGAALLVPTNELIVKARESFKFVPVFFFVEFTKRSDLDDTASDFILQRSFDHESELANKARNADTRTEFYGPDEKFEAAYVESLCFAGFVYGDHALANRLLVMPFERGEFTHGKTFVSAITLRKVPLWSQVWELHPELRDRGTRKWWGLDFRNPDSGNFIKSEEATAYQAFHDELKEDFRQQKLRIDRSDEGEHETSTVDVSEVTM